MGLVRFLLAAAVVLGHAPGWGRLSSTATSSGFVPPYFAVELFFVVSGFYMSLIQPRYAGRPWTFYGNRFLRLAIPFWIVSAVTVALMRWNPGVFPAQRLFETANPLLWFTNLFLLGADWVAFFPAIDRGQDAMLIPQAWSLGTELAFYLAVPLLVQLRSRWLVALLAGSVGLRVVLLATGLPFYPWQQRFAPVEVAFFILGILSHRVYCTFAPSGQLSKPIGLTALTIAVYALTHIGFVWPLDELNPWRGFALAAGAFVLLPPIFALTGRSAIDRFIGEFSYPIYLWHIVLGYFVESAQRLWEGGFLLLLCVLFSIPLVLWVERPMERWRAARLTVQQRAGPEAVLGTLVTARPGIRWPRFVRGMLRRLGPV
jgi:peptidoglycan/LPS O-acetylase OafA/YrhL